MDLVNALIGGSIQDKHYQRYIQALLAKGLGQVTTPSQSACRQQQNYIDEFRTDKSSNVLNQEDHKLLAGLVAEIRFRSGRTDAPIQLCRVKLKAGGYCRYCTKQKRSATSYLIPQ